MNILLLGNNKETGLLAELCQKSKQAHKIYSTEDIEGTKKIPFEDYNELVCKAKKLQIDIIMVQDEKYISDGSAEFLQKNRLNVISVNKKWLNLEKNRIVAKQLAEHYSIRTPKALKIPSKFPVVIKSTEPFDEETERFAYSMDELIEKKNELVEGNEKPVFIEEYLEGNEHSMLSLWDGKSFLHFTVENINEVQKERLNVYKMKMNFMFSDEKANFIGFVLSKLLWAKNEWYILEYKMSLDEKSLENLISKGIDLPYILNLALYQKLGEICEQ